MITASQRDSVVNVLAKMLQAIDAYRSQIEIDPTDLGTTYVVGSSLQPDLDVTLKSWRHNPVGRGLRQGVREIGRIVAPHVDMQALQEIAHDASERSQNVDSSVAIFNHMWDGLKTSDGHTWCA
jgi:hypothetical protein